MQGSHGVTLHNAAAAVDARLTAAGYRDQRWYPIGVDFIHGFAVTTRLERQGGGENVPADVRWLSLHPRPATLRWLASAATVPLPEVGRYDAFLIAFTDLPRTAGSSAPKWNADTLMDGPGAPEHVSLHAVPDERPTTSAYRYAVYRYVYERDDSRDRGRPRAPTGGEAPRRAWPPSLQPASRP